jgi:2-oxoglutarate dehydrogenase E2 component (dihydrolipoamide succinyltransferase)
MRLDAYLVIAALAAAPALAQQKPAPAKTTEQQARSYIASAFMTGAAPAIVSEKAVVSPELRQRLGLAPEADSKAVYKAVTDMAAGKPIQVRRAAADEIAQSEAPAPVSEQPIFALEAGDATLLIQYDLAQDNIAYVGLPGAVAMAAPVIAPSPPQRVAEPTIAAAPAPAPKPAAEAPKPAPAEQPQALQFVEPQVPRAVKPPAAPARPAQTAQAATFVEPARPVLRKAGPCEIKPVMSDQDLVNCGATPR